MSQQELLDVVNKEDEVIDQRTKKECHSNPDLIHRVAHCWLFNSDGQFLWQQRSLQKKEAPGMWDMSCGGHILAGEDVREGLLRELEEELGVTDTSVYLVEKYIRSFGKQTEMIYLYFAYCDLKEDEFELQEEEVEQVKWYDYHVALKKYHIEELESTDFIIDQVSRIYQHLTATHSKRMLWLLPDVIKETGFDFRWDVEKVWGLDAETKEISIDELTWHFDIPFWFTKFGFYDLKPREVIENPDQYKERYERIMETDLTYPLDIMWNKGRWVLLDGLHRLVRHYIEGHKTVKVRKIPREMISKIEK